MSEGGTKKRLGIVEELKVRGGLLEVHPSCFVSLFPFVRVVEAS
jgi:hypothetical protein